MSQANLAVPKLVALGDIFLVALELELGGGFKIDWQYYIILFNSYLPHFHYDILLSINSPFFPLLPLPPCFPAALL